jgi:excisionase family DNA binding protein
MMVMRNPDTTAAAPLVYSIQDLPKLIGLGLSRVKLEIAAGRLRTIRSGRRRLVPAGALHEWVAEREREANAAELKREGCE